MILSLNNGRLETTTVSDMNPAFQNIPIDEHLDVLIEAPEILARLGIVKKGMAWKIRQRVCNSKEECRARQEERDQ
eukprot:10945374-Prorocentrum_lima.AAC.1